MIEELLVHRERESLLWRLEDRFRLMIKRLPERIKVVLCRNAYGVRPMSKLSIVVSTSFISWKSS